MPALSRARHGQRLGEAALVDAVAEHLRADARRAGSVLGEAVAAAEDGQGSPCRVCCGVELAGRAGGGEHLALGEKYDGDSAGETGEAAADIVATRCCPCHPVLPVAVPRDSPDVLAVEESSSMYAQADLFIIYIGRWRLYHPGRIWYLCFIVVGVGPAYIATS
jgi:hypothetical protein